MSEKKISRALFEKYFSKIWRSRVSNDMSTKHEQQLNSRLNETMVQDVFDRPNSD